MYVHFPFSDVEQIDAVMPEAHSRILQYSPGRLAASSACLVLPELRVVRNESNQGLLIEISADNDTLDIVLLEHASDTVNWMGQELASDSLVIFPPGKTTQYRLPLRWRSIEFSLDRSLCTRLGMGLSRNNGRAGGASPLENYYQINIGKARFQALLSFGRRLLHMGQSGHSDLEKPAMLLHYREQVIERLQAALFPAEKTAWKNISPANADRLILQAQQIIEQNIRAGEALNVPDLASRMNLHERQLYKLFREKLGISPYAWAQLVRMHQFREHIFQAPGKHGIITQTALNLGFHKASNFSAQFKRQFGETPRQFLQRCSSD